MSISMQSQQSEPGASGPPPGTISRLKTSDVKFDQLFMGTPGCVDERPLKIGDTFRICTPGGFLKDIKVLHFGGSTKNPRKTFRISIPPGNYPHSEPHLRQDIIFPNQQSPYEVTGPAAFWAKAELVSRRIICGNKWDDIYAVRDGEILGRINDFRLAVEFAMNECDFQCQLTFTGGRRHRLSKLQQDCGFHNVLNTLYLKVALSDIHTLNGALVIDFGPTLNAKLEACASTGYTIVMVDIRVTNAPDAFPTRYTRNIANQCGWSQGYAHMGIMDLARDHGGFNISGLQSFYRTTGQPSCGKSQDAPPVSWQMTEITKVYQFHHNQLRDKTCHYPAPLTRVRREGVTTFQYRKFGNVWKVDPDVHGQGYEHRTIDPQALHFQQSSASLDSDQIQWSSPPYRNQTFYTTDYSLPTTPLSQIFDTTKNGAQYSSPYSSYFAHSTPYGRYAASKPEPALSDQQFYIDGWGNERYPVSEPQSSEDGSKDSNLEDEPQDNPESLYPEVPEFLTPVTYQQ